MYHIIKFVIIVGWVKTMFLNFVFVLLLNKYGIYAFETDNYLVLQLLRLCEKNDFAAFFDSQEYAKLH